MHRLDLSPELQYGIFKESRFMPISKVRQWARSCQNQVIARRVRRIVNLCPYDIPGKLKDARIHPPRCSHVGKGQELY